MVSLLDFWALLEDHSHPLYIEKYKIIWEIQVLENFLVQSWQDSLCTFLGLMEKHPLVESGQNRVAHLSLSSSCSYKAFSSHVSMSLHVHDLHSHYSYLLELIRNWETKDSLFLSCHIFKYLCGDIEPSGKYHIFAQQPKTYNVYLKTISHVNNWYFLVIGLIFEHGEHSDCAIIPLIAKRTVFLLII